MKSELLRDVCKAISVVKGGREAAVVEGYG